MVEKLQKIKNIYKDRLIPLLRNVLLAVQKQKTLPIWAFTIAFAVLLPAAQLLVSGHTLIWRDTSKLFQPTRQLIVESLRDHHLPLWNPYEALGIPLFAQMMHGVLHPVSVIGAFLFPQAGMDVFILIYLALAALGSALLARLLGASLGSAAVAGIGYGLSGFVLGMGSIVQYLCAASSAPWAILGLRMAGEKRRFGIVAAAAAIAVLHFAGDPQWASIAIVIGIVLAIEAGGKKGLLNAILGVAIGTALAGIQLIPTMAYFREASRAIELNSLDRKQWALAPWRIIEFIVPGFFGSPDRQLGKWPVFLWLGGLTRPGMEMPFAPSVYMGAGLLVLAVAGILHSRVTRVFGIATLVTLWLALGANAGAEQLTHLFPVWDKFRYSEKMVGPLTLCLSVLASFGAEQLSMKPARFWMILSGSAGLVSLLLSACIANWQNFDTLFTDTIARQAAPYARYNLKIGLMHTGITLVALAGIIAGAYRWARFRTHFPVVAAGFVFLQSSFAAPYAMHAGMRNIRDEQPLSQIKNIEDIPRIATPLQNNYLCPNALNEYDAEISIESQMGVASYNVPSHIDQLNTYTGLRPRRFESLMQTLSDQFGVQSLPALRRYAITHMIIRNPNSPDEIAAANAASEGGVKVLDNSIWGFTGWKVPHRPWATFATQIAHASDEKEALDTMVRTLGRGEFTVVLEDAPDPKEISTGQILKFIRGRDWLSIEATSQKDGILIVNDSYWPGWKATIDGFEVPIWRADFLVRAVPWRAGHHVLEMKYEPLEVQLGWIVSLTGIIALIFLLVFEWQRKRSH